MHEPPGDVKQNYDLKNNVPQTVIDYLPEALMQEGKKSQMQS
jgi:hypothetical protein